MPMWFRKHTHTFKITCVYKKQQNLNQTRNVEKNLHIRLSPIVVVFMIKLLYLHQHVENNIFYISSRTNREVARTHIHSHIYKAYWKQRVNKLGLQFTLSIISISNPSDFEWQAHETTTLNFTRIVHKNK